MPGIVRSKEQARGSCSVACRTQVRLQLLQELVIVADHLQVGLDA